jgi:hypothetical protein
MYSGLLPEAGIDGILFTGRNSIGFFIERGTIL